MFFSRKTEGKVFLMIEIQSSLVRGSLVWVRKGVEPHIMFVDMRNVPHKADADTNYFVKVTVKALGETVAANTKKFISLKPQPGYETMPHKIEEVHYVLSSPWAVSQARTIALSFKFDTKINDAKIHGILDAERSKITPKGSESTTEIIEEKIFDVRLNGYSVADWRNKETRELEVSYAVTAGSITMTKRFREAVDRVVPGRKVHFHSSLLLQYVGLCALMPERHTYTLIHIHGELTDVVVVKDHSCTFFGSYPMGIRTILSKVAKSAKADAGVAESLLTLYVANKLEPENSENLKPVFESLGAGWAAGFQGLFKQGGFRGPIPSDTLIAARTHEGFFVESFVRAYPLSRVKAMNAEEIASHIVYENRVDHLRVVGIYVRALCDII